MASPMSNKDIFESAILNSSSVKETIERMGLRAAGGNFAMAKKWSNIHNIPLPEYKKNMEGIKNHVASIRKEDKEIFVEDSKYSNRNNIKKRMIMMGIMYQCSNIKCPSPEPEWAGKKLSLHLDHINGIHNDNRIENLRLLCPNCHSQTETFAGRNMRLTPEAV